MVPLIAQGLLLSLLISTSSFQQVTIDEVKVVNLNWIFDTIVSSLREDLLKSGRSIDGPGPSLPPIGTTVRSLTVNCSGGRIVSLGPIQRIGNTTMRRLESLVTLRASLHLDHLQIKFDECRTKGRLIDSGHPVLMSADSISLVGQLSGLKGANGTNCTTDLDYLVITDLGHLKLDIQEDVLGWLKELILNLLAKVGRDSIVKRINQKLETAGAKALVKKREKLCSDLFFLGAIAK